MKTILAKIQGVALLLFSIIFGVFGLSVSLNTLESQNVYAERQDETSETREESDEKPSEESEETAEEGDNDSEEYSEESQNEEEKPAASTNTQSTKDACQDQTGALAWVVCPSSGIIANATDSLYKAIEDMLIVTPISMESNSPVYVVWQYARNITNIIFIIILLIVIYSQLTGLGLNNYGIKRVLPRFIIAVLLVNLSFIICTVAVDVSNIIGNSLRNFFESIEGVVIDNAEASELIANFSLAELLSAVIGGGAIAGVAIGATGGAAYVFFMLVVVLVGALISVISGLITISARQALVSLLVMISPLAFVAYLLPNTEKWFNKWKDLLFKMLIFYPMFSFLFGASQLVGYTLIISATSAFGVILGVGVQIFPLFASWSLMKMSGTILNSINTGVRRLASPVQKGLTGWSLSRAENSRQHYFAHSTLPGAKLRRYLDYRQRLRELDTKNSMEVREGRALKTAFTVASSSTGRDKSGNDTWRRRANRYTRNAKTANYYNTVRDTAHLAYQNTLSGYGRHFEGAEVAQLADAHGEAYKDAMAQQFLAVNEAQADQEWLLNEYLKSFNKIDKDPREFNRLVRNAAGGLGHNGESSIMGQVIIGNSNIENRRRSEARIMINKFGIQKLKFRGMVFDKQYINDNGIYTDERGHDLENDQYRLKDANSSYVPWQEYIGVHKTTGAEISKDVYDRLSAGDRDNYRRVRYFDITNDKGETVQRVFEDDAGYMKELLRDDIYIGDPINRRYMTEIGVGRNGERDGILRRYHSTITGALNESRYKDHAAEVTPMITSQANMGYIRSIGQYNIANLQSLAVASKAGSFLQNDSYVTKNLAALIESINDEKSFSYYFPDEDIMGYLNVNGKKLDGLFLGTNKDTGEPEWQPIDSDILDSMDPAQALEYRKNTVKHKILPRAAAKIIGMANRNLSPNLLENQKPDSLAALIEMLEKVTAIGLQNADPNIPFTDKLDGNKDLFDTQDPNTMRIIITKAKKAVEALQNQTQSTGQSQGQGGSTQTPTPSGNQTSQGTNASNSQSNAPTPSNSSSSATGTQAGTPSGATGTQAGTPSGATGTQAGTPVPPASPRAGTGQMINQLNRSQQADQEFIDRNSLVNILDFVNSTCMYAVDVDSVADALLDYFDVVECLQPLRDTCSMIIENYRFATPPTSTAGAIHNIVNNADEERYRIDQIHREVIDLIQTQANTY